MMAGMELSGLRTMISGTPLGDVDACRRELEHVRAVRGMLDAREVDVLARLDELAAEVPAMFPEDELAKAAKTSLSKAIKIRNRKTVCDHIRELADALTAGATTGERVDTLARATVGLTPGELDRVAEHGAVIARSASEASDRHYRETIERIIGQARHD